MSNKTSEKFAGLHFVGSLPPGPENIQEAVAWQLCGFMDKPQLIEHLSSGECDRRTYTQPVVANLAHHLVGRGAAQILHSGWEPEPWQKLEERLRLRLNPGKHLMARDLNYAATTLHDWQGYQNSRENLRRLGAWQNEWRFQTSLPTPFSLAVTALGPANTSNNPSNLRATLHTLHHYSCFRDATVEQAKKIARAMPAAEFVTQVEATAETVLAATYPRLAPRMGRLIANFVNRLPDEMNVNLHLCLGRLGNQGSFETTNLSGMPNTLKPLVTLLNNINGRLNRPPIHAQIPVAATNCPVPLEDQFYQPLSEIKLLPRIYFGFINNHNTLEEHLAVWQKIKNHLPAGQRAGVSTSCGMGSYSAEAGAELHKKIVAVTRAIADAK